VKRTRLLRLRIGGALPVDRTSFASPWSRIPHACHFTACHNQLFSAPEARFELLAPSAVVADRVHKLGVTRK